MVCRILTFLSDSGLFFLRRSLAEPLAGRKKLDIVDLRYHVVSRMREHVIQIYVQSLSKGTAERCAVSQIYHIED